MIACANWNVLEQVVSLCHTPVVWDAWGTAARS